MGVWYKGLTLKSRLPKETGASQQVPACGLPMEMRLQEAEWKYPQDTDEISSFLELIQCLPFVAHLFPGQARSFADDALIKSRPLWRKAAVHTGIPPWFWKLGCFLMYISVRKSDKFPKCGYICMVIVLRVICFLKERFFFCLFVLFLFCFFFN